MPILTKLNEAYKLWHSFFPRISRFTRYTIGTKIDTLFTDCLELALLAGYTVRADKLNVIQHFSTKLDSLKFFLKIIWEIKALDTSKYTALSALLAEVGKMTGGWMNILKKETPPMRVGGE